jgi:hypothetical protein
MRVKAMRNQEFSHILNIFGKIIITGLVVFTIVLPAAATGLAQRELSEQVQVLNGTIFGTDDINSYTMHNLLQGEKLSVYVEGTSGNLDPFAALLSSDQLSNVKLGEFDAQVQRAIDNQRDPLLVVSEYADTNFLAWDDDGGGGFSSAFEYIIPADGDYYLLVLGSPFTDSFGEFRLVVGRNPAEAVTGRAANIGDPFVVSTGKRQTNNAAVQEITDAVSETAPENQHRLIPFEAGDTLYVHVETVEGDLIPQVVLRAYGTKPIRSANVAGSQSRAAFEYTFPAETSEYLIEVIAKEGTSGSYKLLVGRNEPAVLVNEVAPLGEALLKEPIEAAVGIKLQQISGIDQKSENYEAVASTMITWNDPALAFRSDECQCENKVYRTSDFVAFATKDGIVWPAYTYLNQQNNRWIQNDYVVVQPNGDATIFERFTTTFQAPDFNFRQFPFDTQTFFIQVDSLYSTSFVNFTPSDFTEVGTQLGEEEWYITDHEVEVSTQPSSTGNETSSFIFRFFAQRHLSFYIYRIFVPLILIIVVAWITFFMEDYGKRVDATTANLLLFIAFNFTIAGELPRLGYLTYMDSLLVGAFAISVFIVAYNVYLKRLEKKERQTCVQKIDKYMIWLYPIGYLLAFLGITWYFFWK